MKCLSLNWSAIQQQEGNWFGSHLVRGVAVPDDQFSILWCTNKQPRRTDKGECFFVFFLLIIQWTGPDWPQSVDQILHKSFPANHIALASFQEPCQLLLHCLNPQALSAEICASFLLNGHLTTQTESRETPVQLILKSRPQLGSELPLLIKAVAKGVALNSTTFSAIKWITTVTEQSTQSFCKLTFTRWLCLLEVGDHVTLGHTPTVINPCPNFDLVT